MPRVAPKFPSRCGYAGRLRAPTIPPRAEPVGPREPGAVGWPVATEGCVDDSAAVSSSVSAEVDAASESSGDSPAASALGLPPASRSFRFVSFNSLRFAFCFSFFAFLISSCRFRSSSVNSRATLPPRPPLPRTAPPRPRDASPRFKSLNTMGESFSGVSTTSAHAAGVVELSDGNSDAKAAGAGRSEGPSPPSSEPEPSWRRDARRGLGLVFLTGAFAVWGLSCAAEVSITDGASGATSAI